MTAKQAPEGVGGSTPGTPLPWRHDTGPALNGRYHTVEDANDDMVCELYDGSDASREANARYIVHACNCFPELLEALEEARLQLEYMDERSPSGTTPAVLARITAAIAKATGASS